MLIGFFIVLIFLFRFLFLHCFYSLFLIVNFISLHTLHIVKHPQDSCHVGYTAEISVDLFDITYFFYIIT